MLVQLLNINLEYNSKRLFDNFNFQINKNDKVVIVGPSGCGKSTIFHLIMGFKQPDSGKIIFDNMEVNHKNLWDIRKKISYIEQNIDLPGKRVTDFIDLVFSYKANSYLKPEMKKIHELFNIFELSEETLYKNINSLSGGEKQRVSLSVALLLKRKIYLLDEVTSSLDKYLKQKVADYFLNQREFTVLTISHDVEWLKNNNVKVYNVGKRKWE